MKQTIQYSWKGVTANNFTCTKMPKKLGTKVKLDKIINEIEKNSGLNSKFVNSTFWSFAVLVFCLSLLCFLLFAFFTLSYALIASMVLCCPLILVVTIRSIYFYLSQNVKKQKAFTYLKKNADQFLSNLPSGWSMAYKVYLRQAKREHCCFRCDCYQWVECEIIFEFSEPENIENLENRG